MKGSFAEYSRSPLRSPAVVNSSQDRHATDSEASSTPYNPVMTDPNPTEIQSDDAREDARRMSLQGNQPPSEIEGYSVLRPLGTGAYGTVWLAREDRTGRMVAIKYYPHRRGLNWSLLNREVEKLATLYASRNIVRLLDVGWNAEPPYYVMEYVENGSLGVSLAAGALGVDETIRITRQVCGALIEAHGAGILHCDLKPDNVLLDAQFQVRLCDFGQSRMSHEQSPSLGTLYYMAPEQADLEAAPDARWDVYAVGALMYHMLTGEPPYRDSVIQKKLERAESLQERLTIYRNHIRDSPPPTLHHSARRVDRPLARIVDQCLAADPRERLPNAQAILDLLASRERNRSRRPLLLLGVLGPILLMAAMVPIFVNAMRSNIDQMEQQLIVGTQERNALMARIQANSLQHELEDQLRELERIVADDEFVAAMTELMQRSSDTIVHETQQYHDVAPEERPAWMQLLDETQARAEQNTDGASETSATSWFLNDARGIQLWRRPFNDVSVGKNYAFRDYFHGTNTQYTSENAPNNIRPLTDAHISLAYQSDATHRYMIALSVPIRSPSGEIIGVFARTAHLGDLQRRLGQDIQGTGAAGTHPEVALADRREAQLLDHPWLTAEVLQRLSEEESKEMFRRLRLDETTRDAIRQAGNSPSASSDDGTNHSASRLEVKIANYRDPVGSLTEPSAHAYRGEWIAAMAAMKSERMPWLVIVQEQRSRTLTPVSAMEARATRQAWIAVFASIGTMLGIWFFVWQALVRSQEPRTAK